jgi:peptidoglycan hydrolase-like protein with peptidoglycan-binding domain
MRSNKIYVQSGLAASLLAVMMMAPSAARAQLSVTVEAGFSVENDTKQFTFPANTATVTGGSGSYTYFWSDMNDGIDKWSSGGTDQAFAPSTLQKVICQQSVAYYTVLVTDTVTGTQAMSNVASYSYIAVPAPSRGGDITSMCP